MDEIEEERNANESMNDKEIINNKNIKKMIILIVSIAIISLCVIYIIIWIWEGIQNRKMMKDLEKSILIEIEDIDPVIDYENDEEAKKLIADRNSLDFAKLYDINNETKAWIKIDKLGLSYPVMQHNDNDYYLGKNIYNEDSIAGSIFLDARNNGFEDKNTIIYGHNMKNDSMFGKLDLIGKGECGKDIDIIIQTKEKSYKYKVFSTYDIEHYTRSIDNINIEELLGKSVINFEKEVDKDCKILTLYTCTNSSIGKTIVHAYLEREI